MIFILLGSVPAEARPIGDLGVEDPALVTEANRIVEIRSGDSQFLDAWEAGFNDYMVVTRPYEGNDSQRWQLTSMGGDLVTIMQMSNGRYLDVNTVSADDRRVVTRPLDPTDTSPLWQVRDQGDGRYVIQHYDTGLYLEPSLDPGLDYEVLLRPVRRDDRQLWQM